MTRDDNPVVRPCCWEECHEPARYTVTFRDQPGHVHDCGPHTAVLREWSDVETVTELPCNLPHGGEWTDMPHELPDTGEWAW